MTIAAEFQTLARKEAPHDAPLWRLYLLRLLYGAIAILMGMQIWTIVLQHSSMKVMPSVAFAMLAALSAVSLLGLRYPLRMLPILFFEFAWKVVWLAAFAMPEALKGPLNTDMAQTAFETSLVIIVPIVIPWRYVWNTYVTQSGDRWK